MTCPRCDIGHLISRDNYNRKRRARSAFFCASCRQQVNRNCGNKSQAMVAANGGETVCINGCVLVATMRGRCAPMDDCKHYGECLGEAARRGWGGWTTQCVPQPE